HRIKSGCGPIPSDPMHSVVDLAEDNPGGGGRRHYHAGSVPAAFLPQLLSQKVLATWSALVAPAWRPRWNERRHERVAFDENGTSGSRELSCWRLNAAMPGSVLALP